MIRRADRQGPKCRGVLARPPARYRMSTRLVTDFTPPPPQTARFRAARARADKGAPVLHNFATRRLCRGVLLALGLMLGANTALAEAAMPLNQEPHITAQLVAGAAGDVLRTTCPSISARIFTVLYKLYALERYARDAGYTEDEVKIFLKDKTEKARIKGLAADYLAKAGVIEGDVESYCRVGRDEIAKATLLGSLLRSSE